MYSITVLNPNTYGENTTAQVEAWEKRLGLLNETLDEWVAVQRNWMYLETIFCAEDIQKQLPDEAAKFQASHFMAAGVPL